MSIKIIPVGFGNPEKLFHLGFMADEDRDFLEKEVQEIYDRTVRAIKEALEGLQEEGRNQTQMADLCGVEQGQISRILKGKRGKNLPYQSILKLAIALDIDLTSLYLASNPTQEKLKTLLSEINKMIVVNE